MYMAEEFIQYLNGLILYEKSKRKLTNKSVQNACLKKSRSTCTYSYHNKKIYNIANHCNENGWRTWQENLQEKCIISPKIKVGLVADQVLERKTSKFKGLQFCRKQQNKNS